VLIEHNGLTGLQFPTMLLTSDTVVAGAMTGNGIFRNILFAFSRFEIDISNGEVVWIAGNQISPCREDNFEIFGDFSINCDIAIDEFIFLGKTQEMNFGKELCGVYHHIEVGGARDISRRMPPKEADIRTCINDRRLIRKWAAVPFKKIVRHSFLDVLKPETAIAGVTGFCTRSAFSTGEDGWQIDRRNTAELGIVMGDMCHMYSSYDGIIEFLRYGKSVLI